MLEAAVQLERDPPETVTSDSMKSVDASERVKVSVAVSPKARVSAELLISIVGAIVSGNSETTCNS